MDIENMWERLAQYQPFADAKGYGEAWARMCEERTQDAALAAANAARDAANVAWANMTAVWGAEDAAEDTVKDAVLAAARAAEDPVWAADEIADAMLAEKWREEE